MSIPFAQELAQLVGHWAPAFAAAIAIFSSMLLCAFLCGKKKKPKATEQFKYESKMPNNYSMHTGPDTDNIKSIKSPAVAEQQGTATADPSKTPQFLKSAPVNEDAQKQPPA
ncbi:hypothetical protein AAVH_05240 [Aphelenchoides avenae]|nr:hypothetical protein AAVH_05240 [Aphelenchus avenae]